MGEYYDWVNVDRKEYICPNDFDYGNKKYESCHRDGEVLKALRDLLSKEWSGCRIFWMGDECGLPDDNSNALFATMKNHCDEIGHYGCMHDTVFETYKNVSGLYKAAENGVREEIEYFLEETANGNKNVINEYGIDIYNPFEGLFQRQGASIKYIINYTRKIGYSFEKTKILYQDESECDYVDPLPLLLGYGRTMEMGEWVGDKIGVSDELPNDVIVLEKLSLIGNKEVRYGTF